MKDPSKTFLEYHGNGTVGMCAGQCVFYRVWCLGKQRSKREAELNTNRPNPGGHERKILTKLMNAEKNSQAAASSSSRDKS